MKNDEIILSTQVSNKGVLNRGVWGAVFGMLAVVAAVFIPIFPFAFCLSIIFVCLMVCLFCFSWAYGRKIRSYVILTEDKVKGRATPARGCTDGWSFFELNYTDILHVDCDDEFTIICSTFGKYKVYTGTFGFSVKLYIEQYGTDCGKELFEHSKKYKKKNHKV